MPILSARLLGSLAVTGVLFVSFKNGWSMCSWILGFLVLIISSRGLRKNKFLTTIPRVGQMSNPK